VGAVDYVLKPFEHAELRARVRAALRTKRYQDLLAARAQLDALTGLGNRAQFDGRLAQAVAAGKRYGRACALVMLDIDHFKRLNDSFGHPFGDRVLQSLGEVLAASVRPTDVACRFGGEEFALILDETGSEGGFAVAERVRQQISALALVAQGQRVRVTASFGIASSDDCGGAKSADATRLLQMADEALYRAKRAGRDRTCKAAGR
jgi:diguanylate cyclase (GGDEF)-like protein